MASPSDATQSLRGEVFAALGQFMLGALLTDIATPDLLTRLKAPHETWSTLAATAATDPENVGLLTEHGTALAAFLGPDLEPDAQQQLGVLLAAAACGQV